MEPNKETTFSFIVRIWIEHTDRKNVVPIWRGVIEYVNSGERVYFDRLEQIVMYVTPNIEAMGVKVDKSKSPFFRWLGNQRD